MGSQYRLFKFLISPHRKVGTSHLQKMLLRRKRNAHISISNDRDNMTKLPKILWNYLFFSKTFKFSFRDKKNPYLFAVDHLLCSPPERTTVPRTTLWLFVKNARFQNRRRNDVDWAPFSTGIDFKAASRRSSRRSRGPKALKTGPLLHRR